MPAATDVRLTPIAPLERRTTVELVEQRLRDEILRGAFRPGEKLPAERELAVRLGITRVTLRGALARLAASRLVAPHQGDGTRVRDVRKEGGLERLPDMAEALKHDPAQVEALVRDLLGLRRAVMSEAAAEATRRATPEALAELEAKIDELETIEDDEAFQDADLDFGRAVVRLSGNLAFELAYNTVVQFGQKHREHLRSLYAARETMVGSMRALVELLRLGEPDMTRNAVRVALEHHDAENVRRVRTGLATSQGEVEAPTKTALREPKRREKRTKGRR